MNKHMPPIHKRKLNNKQYFNDYKIETLIINKVFENMSEGVVITNKNAEIIYVNSAFEVVTKYRKVEVMGKNPNILQSGLHGASFYNNMWTKLNEEGLWEGEIWNKRKTGEVYPELLKIFKVTNKLDDRIYFVALFSDITTKKQFEEQLEELTYVDQLTRVSNRSALNMWLNSLLESTLKADEQFAVLYIDLDRFKIINDSLGLSFGDELLRQFSKRIKGLLQKGDFIARLGGDEFVIVLPKIKFIIDINQFCQKVISSLKEPFIINDEELFLTCSIGVSIYPDDGDSSDLLLRNADKAMYCAKLGGRNSYRIYESTMHNDEEKRLQMENYLRKALDKNELFLQYQPIINMEKKSVVAVEALLRWNQENLGFISPGDFIPLAEETGLIIQISEWVILEACRQLNEFHDNGFPYLKMSINISAAHFNQDNFVEKIAEILTRMKVKRQHVILELTESMIMSKEKHVIKKLVRLKQLGIQLAIDDFGTGYSSLSYLNRFPIDILKIDQSFIKHIDNYKEDIAIVRTIIMLAKILNLSIVAEGVESKRQFDFLSREGCTNIQGFFITKPLSSNKLLQFLSQWDPNLF